MTLLYHVFGTVSERDRAASAQNWRVRPALSAGLRRCIGKTGCFSRLVSCATPFPWTFGWWRAHIDRHN